jgi:voltage-gated potassium channel
VTKAATFDRFSRWVEWPMAILALAVVPAMVLESRTSSPGLASAAITINWIVWVGFVAEYVIKLALAPARAVFIRRAWFDLVIILFSPPFLVPDSFQALRSARLVRLVYLVRVFAVGALGLRVLRGLLAHHRFSYVMALALAVVALGALAIYALESPVNPHITSLGDALWWAVVTATTVGYGDVSPQTPEGRVVAVFLMITGIGVIGVFTATLASYFLEQDSTAEQDLVGRLTRVEAKLDQLLEERTRTDRLH